MDSLFSFFDFHSCAFLRCLCIHTLRHILVISLASRWTVHTKGIFHLSKRVSYLLLHACLLWLLVLAWLSLDVLHQRMPVTLSRLWDFKVKLEPELLNFYFYLRMIHQYSLLSTALCFPELSRAAEIKQWSSAPWKHAGSVWVDISAHAWILGNRRSVLPDSLIDILYVLPLQECSCTNLIH